MTRPRGMLLKSARRGEPPVVGPYARIVHADPDRNAYRVALTEEGRRACDELLALFHYRPVKLVRTVGALRGVLGRALAAGMDDDDMNGLCLEAAAHAVRRFQPGRGAELRTSLPWAIRAVFNAHFQQRESVREVLACDLGDGDRRGESDHHFVYDAAAPEPDENPVDREDEAAHAARTFRRLAARASLTRRERVAVLSPGESNRAAARLLGITKERVRQVRHRSEERLREAAGLEDWRAKLRAAILGHIDAHGPLSYRTMRVYTKASGRRFREVFGAMMRGRELVRFGAAGSSRSAYLYAPPGRDGADARVKARLVGLLAARPRTRAELERSAGCSHHRFRAVFARMRESGEVLAAVTRKRRYWRLRKRPAAGRSGVAA